MSSVTRTRQLGNARINLALHGLASSVGRALRGVPGFAGRMGQVLALLCSTSAPLTALVVVLRILESLLLVGLLYAGKLVIDSVSRAEAGDGPDMALFLVLAMAAGTLVISQASQAVQAVLGELLVQRVRHGVLSKAAALDYAHFESPAFFDAMSRAQREAGYRPVNILYALLDSGKALVTISGLLLLVGRVNPWLGLLLIAASAPFLVSQTRHAYLAWRLANWATPETREMGYIGFILTDRQPAKEVRLFGFGGFLLDRQSTIFRGHHARTRSLAFHRAAWGSATGVLAAAAFVGAAAYLADRVGDGALSVGEATVVVAALLVGQGQVQAFVGGISSLYENNMFMRDLFGFLALPEPPPRSAGAEQTDAADRGVRFEGVSFRYPQAAAPVLHGVDFGLHPGEIVALVGANGAGKTTLVKLLCGLYEPDAGRVLLDGVDLREIDRQALWTRVAVNFQDYARYSLTVRENVGLGQVGAITDAERVSAAVRDAGASVIVDGLPKGYETRLGRMFEDGHDLSDGQWQRIALARAFMKGAPVLVLDEPTASADPRAEYQFFQRVVERVRDEREQSVLLISHRFGNVRQADRIYVMKDGRIVEQGAHEELVAKRGVYAELFALQAAGYQ